MNNLTIGLECLIPENELNFLKCLNGLPLEKYQLFIQTLMLNDLNQDNISNRITTLDELEYLSEKYGIMEMTLSIFPADTNPCVFFDYSQYLISPCICCIVFYDVSFLEIYAKSAQWLDIIEGNLRSYSPISIAYKTVENDSRSGFF